MSQPAGGCSQKIVTLFTYSAVLAFFTSDCMVLDPSLNFLTALSKYSEIQFSNKLSEYNRITCQTNCFLAFYVAYKHKILTDVLKKKKFLLFSILSTFACIV